MSKQYVLLTGAINNAGDHLIGHRAKELLKKYRPDASLIEYERWKPLTGEQLDIINASDAVLLTGGPAIQRNIYPGVYPLVENLNEIKVPLILFGVGWKNAFAGPKAEKSFAFTDSSMKLFDFLKKQGHTHSVRDYAAQRILSSLGINSIMTGCPAFYELDDNKINKSRNSVLTIGFSLGVMFLKSKKVHNQQIALLRELRKENPGAKIIIALHHNYEIKHLKTSEHNTRYSEFVNLAQLLGCELKDISGDVHGLIDFYSDVDAHIGYRVHAHIFMTSLNKPSILVSEDSRGQTMSEVLDRNIIHGVVGYKRDLFSKIFSRLIPSFDRYIVGNIPQEVHLAERITDFSTVETVKPTMISFLRNLP